MPPRSTPGRRKTDPENVPNGALGQIALFIKSLGNPADIKSSLAFAIAVATSVWAIMGINGNVNQLKPQVANLKADVQETQQELNQLQRSRDDLNRIIRQAVEAGVQRGVARALRETQKRQ